MTSRAWPVVVALSVVFLAAIANAPTPLYVAWQRDLGLSDASLMWVFGAAWLAMVPATLLGGWLADRRGRRAVLGAGAATGALACAAFAVAQSAQVLVLARAMGGVAMACAVTAGVAAIADVCGAGPAAHRRAAALASIAVAAGVALGPLVAGIAAQISAAPQVAAFATVGLLQVAALLIAVAMPAPASPRGAASATSPPGRTRMSRSQSMPMRGAVAILVPGILGTGAVLGLAPSMLATVGSVPPALTGAIAFAAFAVAVAVQPWARRLAVAPLAAAGSLASVVAMATLVVVGASAPSIGTVVLFAVTAGAAFGVSQLAAFTIVALAFPAPQRAQASAVLNVVGYAAVAVLPIIAGYMSDAWGLRVAVGVYGAAVGAAAVVAALRVPRAVRNLAFA